MKLWMVAAGLWMAPMSMAADDVEEEITVYGDAFARWDDTRWIVEMEQVIPAGLQLQGTRNVGFWTQAVQTRAVLACDKEWKLGKKSWEVACEIEDIGLLATTRYERASVREIQRMNRVLEEIDDKLTGAKLQLQVGARGTVQNIDIEGLTANNRDQARSNEALRQMLFGMAAGFHMKLDKGHLAAKEWVERGSRMMDVASVRGSAGSSVLEHGVTWHGENLLVQTRGRGTISVPYAMWETKEYRKGHQTPDIAPLGIPPEEETKEPPDHDKASFAKVELELIGPTPRMSKQGEPTEILYTAKFSGVALYNPENGIMTERVWALHASPTASAMVASNGVRNVGALRQLGDDETVEVGKSELVAGPEQKIPDVPAWVAFSLP